MQALIREPLVHFLLLGLLLLAGRALFMDDIGTVGTVQVTAADIDRLRQQWRVETGRPPKARELQALIRQHVDEALLFREAKRLRLHRSDPVVRQRLIRNMRFAEPDGSADDAALLQGAYALGMVDTDPVVRRRLVQRMRHRIEGRARLTPADIKAHGDDPEGRPRSPARYSFQQLFFSPDAGDARAAAEHTLNRLHAGQAEPAALGDGFLLGRTFSGQSRAEIERRFGDEFAASLVQAPSDNWSGPVASAYGLHLVRLEAVEAGRPATDGPRSDRLAELYAERERAQLRIALDRIRQRYRVEIAPMRLAQAPGS